MDDTLVSRLGWSLDAPMLATTLSQALRSTLFSSGASVSPGKVQQIGREMGVAFFVFYENRDIQQAELFGQKLAFDGLGPRSVLSMTEALRVVCAEKSNPLASLTLIAGDFSNATLVGYMAGREQTLLLTQERTHRAYVAALVRQQGESNPPA